MLQVPSYLLLRHRLRGLGWRATNLSGFNLIPTPAPSFQGSLVWAYLEACHLASQLWCVDEGWSVLLAGLHLLLG